MDPSSLFGEDEVCIRSSGKGLTFGLILEDSSFVSSDEEEDEVEGEERLTKGTIRVAWHPSGKETVVAENKVHLVDRSLMPGDVVRRSTLGQGSQFGYVTDMDVKAHVRVLNSNKYIYNVDSRDLMPILPYEGSQEVLLDSWWGTVDNVNVELVLTFPDGAKCRVDDFAVSDFSDVTEKPREGEFSMGPRFPGQELKGQLGSLVEAKWIHSTPRYNHKAAKKILKSQTVTVVVEKVDIKSVEVQWVFGGSSGQDSIQTPPPKIVTGDHLARLKVLNWFRHCSLQIGDKMLYQIKNDDIPVTTMPSQIFDPEVPIDKERGIVVAQQANSGGEDLHTEPENQATALGEPEAAAEEEYDDEDFEDVDFDEDSDSADEKPGPQKERPGGMRGSRKKNKGSLKSSAARLKNNKTNQKTGAKRRAGRAIERQIKPDMVVEVETEFTTSWASVMWQDGTVEKDIPSTELFPVHHLDEHEFFPGDFVLPNVDLPQPVDYGVVFKADHEERTCIVHWFKAYIVGKETRPTLVEANCEVSVYDIDDHSDYKFRPGQTVVPIGGQEDSNSATQMVGQIFELDGNGHLVVKWADGSISQRYPQEVFIISDEMVDGSDDDDDWDSESSFESDASSAETWETESEHEVDEVEDEAKAEGDDNATEGIQWENHRKELDTLLGRAQSALERLQGFLNAFDVNVQAPECFQDILRIFRSCNDLDKILKSSFFRDTELRLLVSQAKHELKREKANKLFSKHLNQVFESWSQNMTSLPGNNRSFGLVSADGQTLKFSVGIGSRSQPEMSLPDPSTEREGSQEGQSALESQGATGGSDGEQFLTGLSQSTSADSCSFETLGLKKEFSEPAISNCLIDAEILSERRPSDSVVEGLSSMPQIRIKQEEANLVGENCVAKASKRVKSDGLDESSRDAKKSKEDKKSSSQMAQELCLKICRNLQKQIVLVHEEMNKRTEKILQASGNTPTKKSSKVESVKEREDGIDSEAVCNNETNSFDSHPPAGESDTTEILAAKETTADEASCSPEKRANSEPVEEAGASLEDENCDENNLSSWADLKAPCKGFAMQNEAPMCHMFITETHQPSNPRTFQSAVRKELTLFQSSLPDGIFVKGFEDRLDLYSAMILGPDGTPYEDAVFIFDFSLPNDYPTSPPRCHYHSYCSDRLNPNLYEDGKVCVSLLGTWSGKGTEMWTAKSNLLQVLVSIQALILVPDPYYNEAEYERQRGSQLGQENSRIYNEMAILKTLQSLSRMCYKLPTLFDEEIKPYLLKHGPRMIHRLRHWMDISAAGQKSTPQNGAYSDPNSSDSGFGSGSPLTPAGAVKPDSVTGQSSTAGNLGCEVTSQEAAIAPSHPTQRPLPASDSQSFSPNQTYDILLVEDSPKPASSNSVNGTAAAGKLDIANNTTAPMSGISDTSDKGIVSETTRDSPVNSCPQNKVSQVSNKLGQLSLDSTSDFRNNAVDLGCGRESTSSRKGEICSDVVQNPDFTLFPMSRGFCLTLQKNLKLYEAALKHLAEETTASAADS